MREEIEQRVREKLSEYRIGHEGRRGRPGRRSDRGDRRRPGPGRPPRPDGTQPEDAEGQAERETSTPRRGRTLIDAQALITFVVGGPAMEPVRAILRDGSAAMATANLIEVLDISGRRYGLPVPRVAEIIEPLLDGPLAAIPLDRAVAMKAAKVRVGHYSRSELPLSLADAVLIASAGPGDRVASSDSVLLAVATASGLETIELPS